jgi:predicted aldo/keto reductase-like oxidoreductase
MEKRNLKNGEISLLGFGLMRLPCISGEGDIDKPKSFEMVDYAIANGINYFDTAWLYHEGQSEFFAGEALSRHDRQSYKLASKMPLVTIKTEADVEQIFTEQLKRCKTSYFDFYLLHNICEANLKAAESCKAYEQLREKQKKGYIGRLGFSFHDQPGLLKKVVESYDFDFAQIQLNYLDWELQNAKEQYKILSDRNIPVNIMEPVRGGSLVKLCDESLRIFREADPSASPASWAIRYAASLPSVQVVLSGMSNMDQLKDNIAVMSPLKPLSEAEYAVIEKALAAYRKAAAVPCTGCRYCMDCPSGVEIPKTLSLYNNYQIAVANKHPAPDFFFRMEYGLLHKEQQASNCVSCGQCSERCPQHIDIPLWMKKIQELQKQLDPDG